MMVHEFFETQRDRMTRKGDWTRAAELNVLPPSEWNRPLKVLVVRLSTYADTSLSITHHYLYALIASLGYYPDRAFLPPARDEELWAEFGIPWLVGIQSHRSGREFGLIAVSNAVVQEMGNLLLFLQKSGFPIEARSRADREDLPLVVLGGANAPFSSLLWGGDSPVDGVFLGEDRGAMEQLFRFVAEGRQEGRTKGEILARLSSVPGFLVPGRSEKVILRPLRATLDSDLLASMPVALGEGNAGKAVLAISGGCQGFCSFCAESWTRKPYTEVATHALAEAALQVKVGQGAARLDLFSFNFNMHSGLYPFLEVVLPWFSALGLKSQRFDSLAADPLLLDLEKLFGKTWFTCGLEGISDRLRRMLNKNLDIGQLQKAFAVFARSGVRELKVFLIATGWEKEGDYEEFGRLLATLRSLPGPQGRPLKVVFSVTPLVRFPQTPLEFEPAPDPREIDRSARRILRTAREQGFDGRVAAPADEASVCDLMVRPPSNDIYATWAETVLCDHFVYRDEIPTWFQRHWQARLDQIGWTHERLSSAYGPEANRRAPWARLDPGIRRRFLEAQFLRNKRAHELVPLGLVRTQAADRALVQRWTSAWQHRQKTEVVLDVPVRLTRRAVDAGREQAAAALARALMQADPLVAQGYLGYRGSYWSTRSGGGDYCALEGDDWISLSFTSEAARIVVALTAEEETRGRVNPGWEPFGMISRPRRSEEARWEVEVRSPWPIDGPSLLSSRGLKHTLRKDPSGFWLFEFPAPTLKKDWIRRLESRQTADGWIHMLVPGSKWDWRIFLEEGFRYPVEGGASRVRLSAREGSLQLR